MIKIIIKDKPKALKRHRMTRSGHSYDPSSKDKKDFILQITNKPKEPITGGIYLKVRFVMPLAKKWYRTGKYAGNLKDNTPYAHIFTPDIDNLLKFVMDAANKVIWKDDSQIWKVYMEKVYGEEPMTIIEVHLKEK